MIIECLQYIIALLLKCLFFSLFCEIIAFLSPTGLSKSWNFIKFKLLAPFSFIQLKSWVNLLIDDL